MLQSYQLSAEQAQHLTAAEYRHYADAGLIAPSAEYPLARYAYPTQWAEHLSTSEYYDYATAGLLEGVPAYVAQLKLPASERAPQYHLPVHTRLLEA